MVVSLTDIKEVFTGLTPVTEILYQGEKVWPTDSGDWVLIEDEYIADASGFYHEKLVKYGEFIPGVTYETPGGIRTTYGFIEDTETTIERLDGYAYLMSDNKSKGGTWAQVKLMWNDIPDWTLHFMSNAESTYDYLIVGAVDANEWTSLPGEAYGNRTTSGMQNQWRELNMPGSGSHHVYVAFRKDGSVDAGKDRGYIYFISEKKEILDTKSGALLPYEYVYYNHVIMVEGKVYKKLEYTATLPNGEQVINEDNYIKGEEISPITEFGGLSLMNSDSTVVNVGFRYFKNGVSLEYAVKDNTPWLPYDITTTVALNPGDIMYVKGVNESLGVEAMNNSTTFSMSGSISASGNIMSLLYGEDYEGKDTVGAFAFSHLFEQCTSLITAPELPATNLSRYCYNQMFYYCRNITTAPELPATTVKEWSYRYMFYGCTSLITAPELPATNIEQYCYERMFCECSNMTTPPSILPATTLAELCYDGMFQSCYALTTAPELPATTLANYCYRNMFYACTSLATAPELPATTLTNNCYEYMFDSCYALKTAPELPATTLADNCYHGMFYNCTGLTTAPSEIPATEMKASCCSSMFYRSAITTPPTLHATTVARNCFQSMFKECKLTTAPELPATTLADNCYREMFYDCERLTTAPELPATTLVESCYNSMFQYCYALNDIRCHANDISASGCIDNWTFAVAATGTFHKLGTAEYPTGQNGIPGGWTVVTE